jgi:integrase
MASIQFSFTSSPVGHAKGTWGVSVHLQGSTKRVAYIIKDLTNPSLKHWNRKEQRFLGGTHDDAHNNDVLDSLRAQCEQLQANPRITTPQQFIEALRSGMAPNPVLTLREYLTTLIDKMKNGMNNKRPSRNYQVYVNLLHKLEREGNIIDTPLEEVSNKHFKAFGDFILSLSDKEGRSNYYNLMKLFKQVHTKAYNEELNDNILRYKYADEAPIKDDEEKRPSLTREQYQQFVNLDLSKVTQRGARSEFYKSLYHNFCIFLYEMKMRPVDVLKIKASDIVTVNKKQYIRYIAEKKKNSKERDKITYAPITSKAQEIINQYQGQSSKGYVFPFALNDYDWNLNDAKSWNQWNIRKQSAIEKINRWLKKIAVILGIDFPLVCYTFRHTTLSHACMVENANWGQIALEAATSIDMLQKHYVSNVV